MDTDLVNLSKNFINGQAKAGRPFFLYLPLTQVHYPTLPSAEFQGRTGNGDFADSVVEMDSNVGDILDAIESAGVSKNTIVIFASDNGPEYRRPWRGTAGFWRGTYHTALEGSLRAPFIMRWPGRVPVGVSNEIVHVVDVFTTLSHLGAAKIPTDRPIDGVDQRDFFVGKREKSNRESFPVYIDETLYAVKWRNWKYHLVWLDDATGKPQKLEHPYLFNLLADPKEETPRTGLEDGWVIEPIEKVISDIRSSLQKYPPIPEGAPNSYVPQYGLEKAAQSHAN
jgi:arylsulfatase